MSDTLETHSSAWNRMYDYRKRWKTHWQQDDECPIRMRGYTELVFGNIDAKLRKKIDTALRRGYTLEDNTQLPVVLGLIIAHCPVANVPIGYVGKTDLRLYVPTMEDAKNMCDELNALSVLTDSFSGNQFRYHPGAGLLGYSYVGARTLRKDAGVGHAAHLKSAYKEMRPAIDQWLEPEAALREKMARWCADDATVIRIPFDSHRDRR